MITNEKQLLIALIIILLIVGLIGADDVRTLQAIY